ncbi:diguanylate cyclase (GGDEF domain) [hydrothermal vent metagenome]|uniref:Diguanylate cyclase (GGDEF domain) n=1 Tax=hydrothermal vent metagenome TaxID=652676 RepID=A0A1W1BG39_9ZZZZ
MSQEQTRSIMNIKIVQLIILLLVILSVSFVSYAEYKDTLKETTDKLNKKIIHFHFETFSQLSQIYLKDTNKHFLQDVKQNQDLRDKFEDMLRLIRISTIQNLFVITRNDNSNYYFLLDSDKNSQTRANILEPFNPLGDLWDKSYALKQPEVYHHNKNTDLWITIAYPIVENNRTVAIIGADISHDLDLNMQTQLHNFSTFFIWIMLLALLWFVFSYLLTLYFRKKYYEGYIDPLTKIYNRKYLYDILLKKLSRRYQLFMVDIDLFKTVNDTYGHDAGDAILKEVAKRLNSLVRDEDSIIRFGGEEFLIYTTKLNQKQSIQFAERLRKNVKKDPIIYKDIKCFITVSIGIYPDARNDMPFDDMFKKADEALYMAKLSGRDCVKVAQ